MICKNPLRFQDLTQTYTLRTAPHVSALASVPSHVQQSSEIVTAQLPNNSTVDELPIALRKGNHTYTLYPLFNFFLCSFIINLSFIYFFFGLMLGSQECARSTLYFRLDSGDVEGDDYLRAKWHLRVGHTSTREESRWVQVGLHCQVKPREVSGSLKCEIGCQMILTYV